MLKICGKSIVKTLLIIYKSTFTRVAFLMSGRKQMLFLSIKKSGTTNLFPSPMKYSNQLRMATKYGVCFLIYQKRLAKPGTKVFLTKTNQHIRQTFKHFKKFLR